MSLTWQMPYLSSSPTRPLVFEDNEINHPAVLHGIRGHAHAMLHYTEIPVAAEVITGMGEYAWHWADRAAYGPVQPCAEGGLEEFVWYAVEIELTGWHPLHGRMGFHQLLAQFPGRDDT